ncbi:MAG: glycosyltransferase family 2 protein [Bacteroidota bacterium]
MSEKKTTDQPLVSIIMAAYNSEKYIRYSIESILKQSYSDIELIIVNDGSNDCTLEIVESYACEDDRVQVISRKENMGCSYSRNEGINKAKGEYFAILDSDDVCNELRISKQVDVLSKKNVDVCGSWVSNINDTGDVLQTIKYYETHSQIQLHSLFNSPVAHSSVMIRAKSLSGLRYNKDLTYAEDYNLWLMLLMKGCKFHNIPEPLVFYRVHEQQSTYKLTEKQLSCFKNVQEPYHVWFSKNVFEIDLNMISKIADKGYVFNVDEFKSTRVFWLICMSHCDELEALVLKENLGVLSVRSLSLGWLVFQVYLSFLFHGLIKVKYLVVIFILCLFGIEWNSAMYKKIENIYNKYM